MSLHRSIKGSDHVYNLPLKVWFLGEKFPSLLLCVHHVTYWQLFVGWQSFTPQPHVFIVTIKKCYILLSVRVKPAMRRAWQAFSSWIYSCMRCFVKTMLNCVKGVFTSDVVWAGRGKGRAQTPVLINIKTVSVIRRLLSLTSKVKFTSQQPSKCSQQAFFFFYYYYFTADILTGRSR